MVESKDITAEEPKELPVAEETTKVVTELADTSETPAAAAPVSTGRGAPGTKEVVPFRWKLVGESSGVVLTLFKGTQREEVDAQHDRVRREGYYTNLRVLDVNEKVAAPPVEKTPKALPKTAKTPAPRKPAKAVQAPAKAPKSESAGKAEREAAKSPAPPKAVKIKPAASAAKRTRKASEPTSAKTKKRATKKK